MARIRRFALPIAVLIAATAAAAASAVPVVDFTVPASHATDPVILTGAQLGDWSVPSDVEAKAPGSDFQQAAQCFADDQSTACDKHNNYANPDVDASPDLPSGTPTDRFLGYRWDAKNKAWQQIPFQVDEMFGRYLDNTGSGFSFYSGDDYHVTYAYDREGFRWRGEDPSDPCHAIADNTTKTGTTPDPVKGLDNNDELVFMAKDASVQAPAGTPLPKGIDGAKEVALTDPTNPGADTGYVYIMKAADGGPKPAFNANNGYVRYVRDADADTYGFSQSDYEGYGNAPRGHFYVPGKGCMGADPKYLGGTLPDGTKCPRDLIHPDQPHFYDCPQRHRALDNAWITTPNYRFRYDGRWLMTKLQVSTDGGQTYGPDLIDQWKARAFQQDPESNTPCCGYEEETTNWGGSSSLLGERVGPVRALRETWGADSGTNVIRRETFYAQQIRQKSYLRVHVIPPLDGIYAQWDFNAGQVKKYYNPSTDTGANIDGHNDEVFGNLDDPCTAHYDQNDTSQLDQGYRQAYQQLTLCTTPGSVNGDCPGGGCHQSIDLMDPTFDGAPNASLNWNEVTGPAGTVVDRITIEKAEDLSPGGAAQSAFAIPYYRDDSCFDDGTGSDPGPKLNPRNGMLSEPTASDGTPRHCWNHLPFGAGYNASKPNPLDPATPSGDDHFFQGDIGTHGVHILMIADSDNARQTVPVDQIVSEQRLVVLPPNQPNVGETYGRSFEKQLVPLATPFQAGSGTGPEEPPEGQAPPPSDSGSGSGDTGAAQSDNSNPAPYPGEGAQPAPAPAHTPPEASESGLLGAHAASPGCLPSKQSVGKNGIGSLRIGRKVPASLRAKARRVNGQTGVVAWCVRGGGRIVAAVSKAGVVELVASSAPKSSARGVKVGYSVREVARKFRGAHRVNRALLVARHGVAFALRGNLVHAIAVADRRVSRSRVLLGRYLAAIDG